MKRTVCVLFILANLIVLAACGILEVGLEPTPRPSVTATATPHPPTATATATALPTETATPTASPTAATTPAAREPRELRVALIKEGNVWLWSEGEGARALTTAGDVTSIEISDDGEVVAFLRGLTLWAVNSDGTDERTLISIDDIAAMVEPGDPGVRLYRFEWVPGTHVVAYNTHLHLEVGLVLNDDLRLVDADTLEQRVLLPRGEGGEFTYAPDGRQIAVVRSGSITLVDAEGQNQRGALTYTPPATFSEFQYYARPVWAPDSGSLRVVLPPVDPLAQSPQLSSVWHLHTDGRPARFIGSIAAGFGGGATFSPDLNHVAYLEQAAEETPHSGEGRLLVTDLNGGETVAYAAQASGVYDWSPDSQRLAFLSDPQLPHAQIGQLGSEPVPAYDTPDVVVIDVRWIDNDRYLCTAISAQEKSIVLGEIGGTSTVIATVTARSLIYDFAR